MLTTAGKVRDVMGLGEDDVNADDAQINELIKIAQQIIKHECFVFHHDEEPQDDPNTGNTWDGSNTSFQVTYPIADSTFDDITDGDDVTGYWISSTWMVSVCSITVSSSTYGLISIFQDDGSTAIPATAEYVYVTYYSQPRSVTQTELEDMCTYLTAHLVQLRMTEPDRITIADLQSNEKLLVIKNTRYLELYHRLLNTIREPLIGST